MIFTKKGPMIYDANKPSGTLYVEYLNDLFKDMNFKKIQTIVIVYSPEEFYVDWRKD